MIAFLLIVIAILLFIIAKSLHNQADELDRNFTNIPSKSTVIPQQKPVNQVVSFWSNWKKQHPNELHALKELTERDLTDISDLDAKQLTGSFKRVADMNNIHDWMGIKPFFLNKFSQMLQDIGEEQSIKIVNDIVKGEVENCHVKEENTASYYARIWFTRMLLEEKKKPQTHKVHYPEIAVKEEPITDFWEHWKSANRDKAEIIENVTDFNMSKLPEVDVKELIRCFSEEAEKESIFDWKYIITLLFECWSEKLINNTFDYTSRDYISLYNAYIESESFERKTKKKNTFAYVRFCWMIKNKKFNEHITDTDIKNIRDAINLSDQLTKENKEKVLELLKAQYIKPLNDLISRNRNSHFFCDGYDSPVAHDIMTHMYSYVRNIEFQNKAKNDGVWNDFLKFVYDETGKITDEYCDADLQECVEYYNFPDKPVKTSHRCPSCRSKRVWLDDFMHECRDCGCQWSAPLGRDLYL